MKEDFIANLDYRLDSCCRYIGGFFIGVIFQRKRSIEKKLIGNLIISDSETDKEPPLYLFGIA